MWWAENKIKILDSLCGHSTYRICRLFPVFNSAILNDDDASDLLDDSRRKEKERLGGAGCKKSVGSLTSPPPAASGKRGSTAAGPVVPNWPRVERHALGAARAGDRRWFDPSPPEALRRQIVSASSELALASLRVALEWGGVSLWRREGPCALPRWRSIWTSSRSATHTFQNISGSRRHRIQTPWT